MKVCPVCSREYPDEIRFCQHDGTTLRGATPTSSLVGQVIADRYHVTKKLGEGGMGQVYLAEHVKMGRKSAIKVMSPAMMHDPDAIARFNREAGNASKITHPNVCAVYDFGETPEGLIYLAMEFVEGEPLTGLLEREGALPLPRATAIFKQTADALQAAHDLGIVHRDLKPDNIMLARGRDGTDVVKVVDFGIAKRDESGQKVTKTGLVVGTPEFMSPEQLSGDRLDGKSDLYSLALVYFRMLTGHLPFQADTVQETMIKRLTDEPKKLAEVRPDLKFPSGLQPVLDAALTRTPGERYENVAKFADDVLGVVQLVRATRGGVAPATREFVEGRTQLLDSHETKAQAARRAPAPKAKRSLVPVLLGVIVVLGAGGGGWVLLGRNTSAAPTDSIPLTVTDSGKMAITPDSTGNTGATDTTRPPLPPPTNTSGQRPGGGRDTTLLTNRTPAIDVSHAYDLLDDMMMSKLSPGTAPWVRDSALKFFNAPGISQKDKAYAAYVVGNAWWNLEDRGKGCEWVRRAIQLDPSASAYTGMASQCQGSD